MMSLLIAGIMIGSGAVLGGQTVAKGIRCIAKKVAEKAEVTEKVLVAEQKCETTEDINEDEVE